jgi:hypothetical protein
MSTNVAASIVTASATLLGVALGLAFQYLRARQDHKWALVAAKTEAYAEFLRSISASYAQAVSEAESRQSRESETKSPQTEKPQGPSQESHKKEEADLRAATARIVLLAKQHISEKASAITEDAIDAHDKIRSADTAKKAEEAEEAKNAVDSRRTALIRQFQEDLGIKSCDQQKPHQASDPSNATGQVDQRR